MNLQLRRERPPESFPEPVPEVHSARHRLVLTHNDFAARNIMVEEKPGEGWRVSAIIDWETSGWLPSYWEYCKSKNFAAGIEGKWYWDKWLPRILTPFELEAEADRRLGEYPWKHIP